MCVNRFRRTPEDCFINFLCITVPVGPYQDFIFFEDEYDFRNKKMSIRKFNAVGIRRLKVFNFVFYIVRKMAKDPPLVFFRNRSSCLRFLLLPEVIDSTTPAPAKHSYDLLNS